MNQKQRDLLCKMLTKGANKVKSELSARFPLQSLEAGYSGGLKITRYGVKHSMDRDKAATLPVAERNRYAALKKKGKKLAEQEDALNSEWDVFAARLEELRQEERVLQKRAIERLEEAIQQATIKVQFAEDAEQAQAILTSLPSVADLLSS